MQNYNNLGNVRLGRSDSIDYESSREHVVPPHTSAGLKLTEIHQTREWAVH